jgi:hypothetical protein
MRFTPSTNLGSLDMGRVVAIRKQGPFDLFGSVSFSHSRPDPVTTPFGGFFSDPFETPESRTGSMVCFFTARSGLPPASRPPR